MSEPNAMVYISTDGSVTTYNKHGVRIKSLSGDLTMLHNIMHINGMSGKDKGTLPDDVRLRHVVYYFKQDVTEESIFIPSEHMAAFVEHIIKEDVEEFVILLKLNSHK